MKKFPPACLNQPSSQCDCSIGSWCAGLWLSGLLSCNLSANQSSLPSQSSFHCQALLLSPSPSGDPPFFWCRWVFCSLLFLSRQGLCLPPVSSVFALWVHILRSIFLIKSSLACKTQDRRFSVRRFQATRVSHKADFIPSSLCERGQRRGACLVWSSAWVCLSGRGQASASNDIFPSQNVLVPFFRLRLCSLGLSDPSRQRYSGLDPETEAQKDHIAVFIIIFIIFNIASNLRVNQPLTSNQAADLSVVPFVPNVLFQSWNLSRMTSWNHSLRITSWSHSLISPFSWAPGFCTFVLNLSTFHGSHKAVKAEDTPAGALGHRQREELRVKLTERM